MSTQKIITDSLAESPNRRKLLKKLGVATAAAAAMAGDAGRLAADPATPTM